MQPGVDYTTFHFPESGANVITTDSSDWATNCPEYKVTAVQATKVMPPSLIGAGSLQTEQAHSGEGPKVPTWGRSEWQERYADFNRRQLDLLAQGRGRETEVRGK